MNQEERYQQAMNRGHSAAWDFKWDQAAAHYREALELSPDEFKALASLGLALFETGAYAESLQYYSRASELNPDDPLPVDKIAEISELLTKPNISVKCSLKAAELYLKNRDVDKAIYNLERVTRIDPGHMLANSRLALIFERTGRKEQAVEKYLLLASLLHKRGDQERAKQAVDHALRLSPKNPEALASLNLLLSQEPLPLPSLEPGPLLTAQVPTAPDRQSDQPVSGSTDPISESFQKSLVSLASFLFESSENQVVDPEDSGSALNSRMNGFGEDSSQAPENLLEIRSRLAQGLELQMNGDVAGATRKFEKAIAAGLNIPAVFFVIGLFHSESGRLESAIRYLRKSTKEQDYALAARLLLGRSLRKMDQIGEATIEYLEALRLADMRMVSPDQAGDLGQLYETLIESENRQKNLQPKIRICDNVAGILLRDDWKTKLAQARKELPGQSDGLPLRPLGEIITEAESNRIVDSIAVVHQLARDGYDKSAMEQAFYSLQYAPTYLPLHIFMGELLLKQEHIREAINKFTLVAETYRARGESTRAVEIFRRVIGIIPMDVNARKKLIDLLIANGIVDDAIGEYINLAEVYYDLADLGQARNVYSQALELTKGVQDGQQFKIRILHRLADIELQSLDWRKAVQIYEQIRTIQPEDRKARAQLIEINLRLTQDVQAVSELKDYLALLVKGGKLKVAIDFVEEIVEENEEKIVLRRRLADLYRQAGRIPDAVKQLDIIGDTFLQAGDRDSAAEVVEEILALNSPDREDYRRLLEDLRGGKPMGDQ